MKTWPLFIFSLLTAAAAPADSMRCGTKLIHEEDTRAEVVAKCGEPAEIERSSIWRRPVVWIHGRPYHPGEGLVEVPVELWIYNFGPHKFMRRVRFEGGQVVQIDTLGYGYSR
jgi:hypothetical protein